MIFIEMMLELVMDMEVDKVADKVVDMKVDWHGGEDNPVMEMMLKVMMWVVDIEVDKPRNLVAKFPTYTSATTWWSYFCEIWENERWNSGQKKLFSGWFGGVLRPCWYICIVLAFQLIIEVRVRSEEK